MIAQVMWIVSMAIVGGLVGLHQCWRRQAADAVSCMIALGLACWQHPRIASYIRLIWPELEAPVAVIYLFAAIYGLLRLLLSIYIPQQTMPRGRSWLGGLIGAAEAGGLAALSIVILPRL
jgi:hypothetical protein